MLWFLAILLTTNLCLGYALGAQFGWSALGLNEVSLPRIPLPGLTLLKRSAPPEGDEKTDSPAPPAVEEAPAATAQEESGAGPAKEEPAEKANESAPPEKSKPSNEQVMEGLAAFQAQLAGLSDELDEAEEDDAFDDCAHRMQQANHEYLDHAKDAIDQLDGDEQMAPVCEAVKAGADEVQRVSDEFDATLDDDQGDAEARREKLRGISSEMLETTKSAVEGVQNASPTPPRREEDPFADLTPLQIDPATGLATLDSLTSRIESLLADGHETPPLVLATIQADNPEDNALPVEMLPLLLPKIGEAVAEMSSELGPPALYKGEQLFIALPGDSVDDASRRVEEIRQQIEATTFVGGGGADERKITVSCALVQSSPESTIESLQELLDEALGEAHRYGGNRACHHDGKFPAPVMPEDCHPVERTVEL